MNIMSCYAVMNVCIEMLVYLVAAIACGAIAYVLVGVTRFEVSHYGLWVVPFYVAMILFCIALMVMFSASIVYRVAALL